MRICIVYDCLFPHTVGGAERWYRNLAERLRDRGHDVTYLTLRQWPAGADPGVAGVDVRPVGPAMELYEGGRRRFLPPVVFGLGVLLHLARRGGRYDVVHTGSMPYFSLLAAALVGRFRRYRLCVDWIEVWTWGYWRDYAGRFAGRIGWRVQRVAARTRHRAFAFARLHARRLHELGHEGEVTVLDGLYAGESAATAGPRETLVVFAGRHIPEKRVPALVSAFAHAREAVPSLRCEIYGDGPDRRRVLELIDELGLNGSVAAPGFVEASRIRDALARAMCLVLPSRREGYGLVVVEAAAAGTPTVVVADPDNAAAELVEDGENGVVARTADPESLGAAIVRVHELGAALRDSTDAWYRRNAARLSIETSVDRVLAVYQGG